jgi:hypothetical protein
MFPYGVGSVIRSVETDCRRVLPYQAETHQEYGVHSDFLRVTALVRCRERVGAGEERSVDAFQYPVAFKIRAIRYQLTRQHA